MDKLKLCPFCGKSVAEPVTACDIEVCANFEDEDCPECYEPDGSDQCIHMIVCNATKGGCGCTTGWQVNLDKAVEAWNRRVKDGET